MIIIAHPDVRRSDIRWGIVTAALVLAGSAAMLRVVHEDRDTAPVRETGKAIAVAIQPVRESRAGGGRPAKAGTPTKPRPDKAKPPTRPVPERAPTPSVTPRTEPQARTRPLPRLPDPHGLPSLTDNDVDPVPLVEPPTVEPAPEASTEPHAPSGQDGPDGDAVETPTADAEGGSGPDPLLERAVAFYRSRLVAWLAARFSVRGSGLSDAELKRMSVRAVIELDDERRVQSYTIQSSDHPAFEVAARELLDGLKGVALPAPPEQYPGAVQRRISVRFACQEQACD